MKKISCLVLAMMLLMSMFSVAYADEDTGVRTGVLSNGVTYTITPMTEEEIAAFENGTDGPMTRSINWSGSVKVPIANASGTNGANVGPAFTSYPDNDVQINVGKMPNLMPSINLSVVLTSGGTLDWIRGVGSYEKVVLHIGPNTQNTTRVKTSTNESFSDYVDFHVFT